MKSYCGSCKRETNQEIIDKELVAFSDRDEHVFGEDKYQIIRCGGCDTVSFRQIGWFSEDINPYTGEPFCSISLYPSVSEDDLQFKQMMEIPRKIRQIYRETIESYNNQNYILCAAGLRAIIEGICAEEAIQDGPITTIGKDGQIKTTRSKTLQGKISGLYERNLITENHANILHEHRFLGNEALHELNIPSTEALKLGIEILEHTLENIYELKYKGQELQYKRKSRKDKD